MTGRRLWSLSGSLLLHGLALAAAVALVSRESPPAALIVELEEAIRVAEASSPPTPSRGASLPAAVRQRPRGPVGPVAPIPERPPIPPPAVTPEPGPSSPTTAQLSAPVSTPVRHADVEIPRWASESGPGAGGALQESVTGGIPGGGPVAMLVPSGGRGEGTGGGEGGILAEFGQYLAGFRQRIQESLSYPPTARRRGLGGTVHLEVELLPTGRVASVVVRSSSSHAVLDQAALDAVSQLQPVPFPPGLPSRPLKVRLPIVFELQ